MIDIKIVDGKLIIYAGGFSIEPFKLAEDKPIDGHQDVRERIAALEEKVSDLSWQLTSLTATVPIQIAEAIFNYDKSTGAILARTVADASRWPRR